MFAFFTKARKSTDTAHFVKWRLTRHPH